MRFSLMRKYKGIEAGVYEAVFSDKHSASLKIPISSNAWHMVKVPRYIRGAKIGRISLLRRVN